MIEQGEKLYTSLGCATCHQAGGLGPQLEGVFGKKRVFTDGQSMVADDSYIRESILNSQAHIVAGYQPIMPTFKGQVSEEQLMQLLAFVKGAANSTQPGAEGAAQGAPSLPGTVGNGSTSVPRAIEGANPQDPKSGTEISRTTEQTSPQGMAPKR
jgi:mono/diheme cytochrome c family protein